MTVFIFPSLVYAQSAGKVSGAVQVTYQQDTVKGDESESVTKLFSKEISLSYAGYAYNPRFLNYVIGGSFRLEDTKAESNDLATYSQTKSPSLTFRINALQGTRYPFTLYSERIELPTWTLEPDGSILTRQTTDRYGILGNIGFKSGLNFRYDYHEDRSVTESDNADRNDSRKKRGVIFQVDGRKGDKAFDASYSYEHGVEDGQFDTVKDSRFNYSFKPGALTNANVQASYYASTLSDLTNTTVNSYFNYDPSSGNSTNVSLYANRIDSAGQVGNYLTLYSSLLRRVGDFSLNQSTTLYKTMGDFGDESTESLTLGASYAKQFPEGLSCVANLQGGGGAEQHDKTSDRIFYTFTGNTEVRKLFQGISTEVSCGGDFYLMRSSLDEDTMRYNLYSTVVSRFLNHFTLQGKVSYAWEKAFELSTQESETGVTESTLTLKKQYGLTLDASVAYNLQLTREGFFDARIGATTTNGTTPWHYEYAEAGVTLIARRVLKVKTGIRYVQESSTATRTLNGNVGVEYRYRNMVFKIKDEVWRENGSSGEKVKSLLFLQVSRPF